MIDPWYWNSLIRHQNQVQKHFKTQISLKILIRVTEIESIDVQHYFKIT